MQQRCAHPIQTGGGGGRREIQLCTRCRTESLQTSLLSMPPLTLMAVFSVAAFTQNRLRHRDRRQWQQNCAAVPSDYTAIKCGNVCVCVCRVWVGLCVAPFAVSFMFISLVQKNVELTRAPCLNSKFHIVTENASSCANPSQVVSGSAVYSAAPIKYLVVLVKINNINAAIVIAA